MWFRRNVATTQHDPPDTGLSTRLADVANRLTVVEGHLRTHWESLQQLYREEAQRAAEHANMVDQLQRLYKRVATRIAREGVPPEQEESTRQMLERLRRKPWG